MKIAMFSNAYLPRVGGVTQSVVRFTRAYRERGHRVMIVAPSFGGREEPEEDVLRVPAVQNFNGSDFSVALPAPLFLNDALDEMGPDIVHAHQPFLLGDTALRFSKARALPLVFTHHTLYEDYTHYVPAHSTQMKSFVIRLSTRYANLCDRVIAPSESVERILEGRGVSTPIRVVPSGVDTEAYAGADGAAMRERLGVPGEAFLAGFVGRLRPEKNLLFLARALRAFLGERDEAWFLAAGEGSEKAVMVDLFAEAGLMDRVRFLGNLDPGDLPDLYASLDVFVFASKTETQGMVVAEAMAASTPVVALDGPGVREVVRDGVNGRLLDDEHEKSFAEAAAWAMDLPPEKRDAMREAARKTAASFEAKRCADRALDLYRETIGTFEPMDVPLDGEWGKLLRLLGNEWDLWRNRLSAAAEALTDEDAF